MRRSTLLIATSALLMLGGCVGHGQYTSEFKEQAQERMAQLKAGTQWDMAQQQFLSGDLKKALRSVDQSIAISDTVSKSHLLRGRILIEMGRLEDAVASIDRAIELKPEDAEPHYYRGIVFERFSKPDEALASYRAAIEKDPTDPQYLLAASEMLVQLGRYDEARGLLEQGRADFQHNAGVRQTLGHIAMMQGDVPGAITNFNEACLLDPDDAALREDLAKAQFEAGQFADAEYSLRRTLDNKDYADRTDLKLMHARSLVAIDRPVEARDILVALSRDGRGANDPKILAALGDVSATIGDYNRVRECAARLIGVAPNEPEGYVLMATLHREKGDLPAAVAALDRAISVAGDDPSPALLQGLLYQRLNQPDLAARSYAAALRADPNCAEAQARLASVGGGVLTEVSP